jgi:valyl-tRNA synthetase
MGALFSVMDAAMLDQFFNAAEAEPRLYKSWEEKGCFKPSMDTSAEAYSIVIPPPNVTGVLHMGHALNNTLQDVLIRFARMQGKNVLWQPGTDHAGIATQMVVERQLNADGKKRTDFSREEFVEKVWEWKEESGGQIVEQLKRLGASCDWSRLTFTMGEHGDPDNQMVEAVRKVFVDLYNDGLIYRDKRLVNWDPHFQTAISDLEVEPREVKGHYWHLRYPLADGVTYEHPVFDEEGEPAGTETRDYIVVATSRPETMLGDTGVAVHPDDERYKALIDKFVSLPIVGRRIPIVADEYPDMEKGSGAVKITPAHDFNDFEVGKRCDLEVMNILTSVAAIVDGDEADAAAIPQRYRGLDRFEAREAVIADFEDAELMHEIEKLKIEQPFGDRSGVVIEPWLTDQWYVNAKELAKDAILAVREGDTRFVPTNWEKTYYNWMEDIQPWCISRQLWWGHRIPVWYGPDGLTYCALTEHEALREAEMDAPGSWRIATREEAVACDFVDADDYALLVQDEDVLDTWFSSGLWPFSTMGWPNQTEALDMFYPGAVLVTAFDIIFFWVARMMMQGIKFMDGKAPFKDVYIHALVLDEKGQKMSKSKGNVMDPLELVDEYGADALRFFLARQATQGRNIRLSKQGVEGYRNFGTKIWNAAKFCQMNEVEFGQEIDPATIKHPTNQWVIGEVVRAQRAVADAIAAYRFNDAADANYRFIWNIYCDWYLELIKPLLGGEDEAVKAETRRVAGWVFDEMLKALHPFMPYLTEELWGKLASARDGFLMLERLKDFGPDYEHANADAELDWVLSFISEVRGVRGTLNAPAGAKPNLAIIGANDKTKTRLARHGDVIKRRARLEEIALADALPDGAVSLVLGEATLGLQVADLIDLAEEKARLGKEIEKLEKDIAGIDKKLANEKFVSRAPPEIIEEQHTRKADAEAAIEKLRGAADQLLSLLG